MRNVPKLWETTNQLKDAIGSVQEDVAKLNNSHKELGKAFNKLDKDLANTTNQVTMVMIGK